MVIVKWISNPCLLFLASTSAFVSVFILFVVSVVSDFDVRNVCWSECGRSGSSWKLDQDIRRADGKWPNVDGLAGRRRNGDTGNVSLGGSARIDWSGHDFTSPVDGGNMPQIQDPIELEEKKESISTILPSLVSVLNSALDIGATIESSPTMVTSSGSTESSACC